MEPETKNKSVAGELWTGLKKLLIGIFVIVFSVVLIIVVVSLFSANDKAEQVVQNEASRCMSVPADVIARIESGLTVDGGGSLRNVKAVKSNDFESVYFISGDLQGSGLEGDNDIATFSTNQLDYSGMTFSVDAVADEFSDWPLGSGTSFNLRMSDDGARESRECIVM
jgi:hypothetical protein